MTTTYVLRSAPSHTSGVTRLTRSHRHQPQQRPLPRVARIVARVVGIIFLSAFILTIGSPLSPTGTTTPHAQAGLLDFNICDIIPNVSEDKIPDEAPVVGSYPGALGTLGGTPTDNLAANERTGFERYGTALEWNRYPYQAFGAECGTASVVSVIMLPFVNIFWQGIALLTQILMTIFGFAIGYDSFTPFLDGMGDTIKTLSNHLFLPYLTPIIMLSAFWIGWRGLVRQRSSEAVQGVLWTVLAAASAMIFFLQPTAIARGVNGIVQSASHAVMTIAPSPAAGGKGKAESICTAVNLQTGQAYDSKNMARAGQCMIWETFYVKPWALGALGSAADMKDQFGTTATNNLMFATTVTRDEVEAKTVDTKAKDTAWKNLIDTLSCTEGKPSEVDAEPNEKCDGKKGWNAFTGLNAGPKIQGVMIAFLGDLFGALPLLFLAGTQVFLSIMTVLLFLAAPFYLTLGVHPGFGRKIALSWVEMVLANVIKRIGTAGLIGLSFVMFGAVASTTLPWLIQVAVIGVVGWGLVAFRGKFLKQISTVNLGGDGVSMAQGVGGFKSSLMGGTQKANHAATTAIAAGGAALGARKAGAGIGASAVEGSKRVASHKSQRNAPLFAAGGLAAGSALGKHSKKVETKTAGRMGTYEQMDWENPKPKQKEGLLSWANQQRKRGVAIPLPQGPQAAAIRKILYDDGFTSGHFQPEDGQAGEEGTATTSPPPKDTRVAAPAKPPTPTSSGGGTSPEATNGTAHAVPVAPVAEKPPTKPARPEVATPASTQPAKSTSRPTRNSPAASQSTKTVKTPTSGATTTIPKTTPPSTPQAKAVRPKKVID